MLEHVYEKYFYYKIILKFQDIKYHILRKLLERKNNKNVIYSII